MFRTVVALAALVAATFAPSAATAEDGPTRVLILGDSVTHGLDGDYTWRYFSWRGLQQTAASVDFVGPHVGTARDNEPYVFDGRYADPAFDTDHAARWGLSMWETLYWNSDTAPTVTDLMAHDPDVVVETLGVNDLTWINQTPEQLVEHAREFVTRARAFKPDVDVVLGTLPQTWYARVPAYNAALPVLAAELTTPTSRVVVTPVARFVNGVDTYDDAHPTTSGQIKIAEAVSVALEELGVGRAVTMPMPATPGPRDPAQPAPPPVAPPAPPAPPAAVPTTDPVQPSVPAAPRKVRAEGRDAKVVVTWRGAADSYRVRCGTASKRVGHHRAVLRVRAARCAVRALGPGGGTSPWVRVTVRR